MKPKLLISGVVILSALYLGFKGWSEKIVTNEAEQSSASLKLETVASGLR